MIRTEKLTKEYENLVAVDNLDIEVYRGEIFGLLGPNGAGKTTTILMLMGLTPPTSGNAWIEGHSVKGAPMEVRKRASIVPENLGLYDELTARHNLCFTAELNGITGNKKEDRVEELLKKVGLEKWSDMKVGKFSKGMKQRLGMADALMKRPKVLMLDEPTVGIDPEGVEQILKMITNLSRDEKVTILLSSHLLHQVQRVCDRVGIMSNGELVGVGSIESLAKEEYTIEAEFNKLDDPFVNKLGVIKGVREVTRKNNRVVLKADRDVRRRISKLAFEGGYLLLEIKVRPPSLDDLYMRYFGA